jgi:hypothetical protein
VVVTEAAHEAEAFGGHITPLIWRDTHKPELVRCVDILSLCLKRVALRQHHVHNHPTRKDVHLVIMPTAALKNLRGHKPWRSNMIKTQILDLLAQPKVHELQIKPVLYQQVLWLQVPMRHLVLMKILQHVE